jgi:hypothetical protein
VRLPPQVAGVVRKTYDRPIRANSYKGTILSGKTTESITCGSGESACTCTNNGVACCTGNPPTCHVDSSSSLCVCGVSR